jgi:hypothetical protein
MRTQRRLLRDHPAGCPGQGRSLTSGRNLTAGAWHRIGDARRLVAMLAAPYLPRRPTETVLYKLVRQNLESFLAYAHEHYDGGLPRHVENELRAYLRCGLFSEGFARCHCDACGHDLLSLSRVSRGPPFQAAPADAWPTRRQPSWIEFSRSARSRSALESTPRLGGVPGLQPRGGLPGPLRRREGAPGDEDQRVNGRPHGRNKEQPVQGAWRSFSAGTENQLLVPLGKSVASICASAGAIVVRAPGDAYGFTSS